MGFKGHDFAASARRLAPGGLVFEFRAPAPGFAEGGFVKMEGPDVFVRRRLSVGGRVNCSFQVQ